MARVSLERVNFDPFEDGGEVVPYTPQQPDSFDQRWNAGGQPSYFTERFAPYADDPGVRKAVEWGQTYGKYQDENPLMKVTRSLTGWGVPRHQTWPEQLARSGFSLAHDVWTGEEPTPLSAPRGDQGDILPPVNPEDSTWAGRLLGVGPVGSHNPLDRLVERAQDMTALAGSGAFPAAEKNALGIFGGRMAKTADLEALKDAEWMAGRGHDPLMIKQATGWEQGADGKWRFEISDDKARLANYALDKINAGETIRAGTLGGYQHPELYQAYPELRNVLLHNKVAKGSVGTHYPSYVAPEVKDLLRQSQEIIQGRSPDQMSPQELEAVRRLGQRAAMLGANEPKSAVGLAKQFKPDMESTMLHELQHSVQDIEDFARGGSPDEFKVSPSTHKYYSDVAMALHLQKGAKAAGLTLPKFIAKLKSDPNSASMISGDAEGMARYSDTQFLEDTGRNLEKQIELGRNGGYEGYRRLAGEVEARNVQERRHWTPEMRRAILGSDTEEVKPRSQQIVRGLTEKGPSASVAPPRDIGGTTLRSDTSQPGAAIAALKYAKEMVAATGGVWERYTPEQQAEWVKRAGSQLEAKRQRDLLENPAPHFYSVVEHTLNASKMQKASSEQWVNFLRNQPGVKAEELSWLGLDDPKALGDKPLTRQQMLDHVQEHGVQIKEVEKTGEPDIDEDDILERSQRQAMLDLKQEFFNKKPNATEEQFNRYVDSPRGERRLAELEEHYQNEMDVSGDEGGPKYSEYQLPDGDNYREKLFTLPERGIEGIVNWYKQKYPNATKAFYDLSAESQEGMRKLYNEQTGQNYVSSHWDERNVLAHVRMNDRDVPGVGKALHLEELQSDWHQEGRKKGYKDEPPTRAMRDEVNAVWKRSGRPGLTADNWGSGYDPVRVAKNLFEKGEMSPEDFYIIESYGKRLQGSLKGVPDAPFKTTWPDLVLKRMVREAAEKGYDAVSWTPGQVHNDRYRGRPSKEQEGMKAFYDKMLVDKANAIGKKFGAKVEWKDIGDHNDHPKITGLAEGKEVHPADAKDGFIIRYSDGRSKHYKTYEEAKTAANEHIVKTMAPLLRITPQLRDAALGKGFPLFSDTSQPGAAVGALAKSQEIAPRFYSTVEHTLNTSKMQKASPEQWVNFLRNQPGVKAEELSWLGLDDPKALGNKPLTRQQMLDHVQEHGVQVKEVEKSKLTGRDPEPSADEVHYPEYQLPGGDNYREKLFTLPQKTFKTQAEVEAHKAAGRPLYTTGQGEPSPMKMYESSHWDEPNVLAHVRMNDRDVPGVGKVLHLEELQSDWHQEGRKKGYKRKPVPEELKTQVRDILRKVGERRGGSSYQEDPLASEGSSWSVATALPHFKQANVVEPHEIPILERYASLLPTGVPDAPFKTTWPDLVLKRMVREAAEKGYDAVSWTPGEQQADRYDLSKQVSKVTYDKSTQRLMAWNKGDQNVLNQIGVPPEKIEDYIGKEAAKKIVEEPTYKHEDYNELSGLDLKVGGEGMKAFYDKMLVDKANAIGKKFGAKVEWKEIEGVKAPILRITPQLKDAALSKGFPLYSGGFPLAPAGHDPFDQDSATAHGLQQRLNQLKEPASTRGDPLPTHSAVPGAQEASGVKTAVATALIKTGEWGAFLAARNKPKLLGPLYSAWVAQWPLIGRAIKDEVTRQVKAGVKPQDVKFEKGSAADGFGLISMLQEKFGGEKADENTARELQDRLK